MVDFTPELVAGLVGMFISWIFGWFPGLNVWYAALKPAVKSGVMLGMLAVASVTVYLLVFYGVLETTEPITLWRLLSVFFFATTINQATYNITPLNKEVKEIKTERVLEEIVAVASNDDSAVG